LGGWWLVGYFGCFRHEGLFEGLELMADFNAVYLVDFIGEFGCEFLEVWAIAKTK
jgi:hypothetical protein